jgi:NtrC-family two-component system response regulator AlgB
MQIAAHSDLMLRALVLGGEADGHHDLRDLTGNLGQQGCEVWLIPTLEEALAELSRQAVDLIFLDIDSVSQTDTNSIPSLLAGNPWTRLIGITRRASASAVIDADGPGVSDYLLKPITDGQVRNVVQRTIERRQLEKKLVSLQAALKENAIDPESSSVETNMLAVLEMARRVARSQATLVIRGETGSGKQTLVRNIQRWSDRADEPFCIVVCQEDGADAMEAELFGLPTGDGKTAGKVEICDRGTLVLQEVGDLPLRLQPAILRLLKDQEFERPDESTCRRCNVRLIATTSRDLTTAVAAGTFRADLLMALNVIQIDIPPLRSRPADILPLAESYLAFFARRSRHPALTFSREAGHVLTHYHWPGNVRELRNIVERAALLCTGETVDVMHLPPNLLNSRLDITIGDLIPLAAVEEAHIRRVVKSARSLRQAATILDIDSGTVVRKMKRYGSSGDPTGQ